VTIKRHRDDGFIGFKVLGWRYALDIAIPTDGLGWVVTKSGSRFYTVAGFNVERCHDFTAYLLSLPYFFVCLLIARDGS
jgi:hypothetical protein